MIHKRDESTSELDKTIYYCLEQLSSETYSNYNTSNSDIEEEELRRKCILVYLDCDKRLDLVINYYNDVFKNMTTYENELRNIDIIMISDSSISAFLKKGENIIYCTRLWENKHLGYSIMCLLGEARVVIYEKEEDFGEFIFYGSKNIYF